MVFHYSMSSEIVFENSIEPVEGKPLKWENVEYSVHKTGTLPLPRNFSIGPLHLNPTHPKQILYSNSGMLPPGSFMAILGSSGAGKTTFLNALAQQFDDNGELTGAISIGDDKMTKKKFSIYCGYVKQEDILLPNCTVRETLEFYAFLRLPSKMTRKQKKERVAITMQKLGLTHCADTFVGGKTKKGISGGEKRRVSIAVELIRDPTILFLDEPTSGLDSRTALSIVDNLVELAHLYNHSVICTIHQPRSQIFNLFDYLMVMAKGKQIYFGKCSEAIPYFDVNLGFPCPKHENPADYFIDLLTIDPSSEKTTKASQERVTQIIEKADQTPYVHAEPIKAIEDDTETYNQNNYAGAGYLVQILLLLQRTLKNNLRDKAFIIGRTVQNMVLAVMVLILFFQMDTDQTAIQDRISVIFMCLLGTTFSEAVAASLVYPAERNVYQRERDNRMYRISAYYIAKTLVEFPAQLAMPALFISAVYFGVGLRDGFDTFLVFLFIIISLAFTLNSFGMLLGSLFPGAIAALMVPSCLIVFLLAAGFYINPENLPGWLSWIVYIDIFFYAFNAAIVNQFTDMEFFCKSDQFITFSRVLTCEDGELLAVSSSQCPITSGDQIIDRFNADEFSIWEALIILWCITLVFRFLTYLVLRNVNPKEVELN